MERTFLNYYVFLIISFIEGAAVMIVELMGAKIIAPFYGTSLYVWSSVLGITLASLAIGYYTGGYLSKKKPGDKTLYFILLVGAFFTAIAPVIGPSVMHITEPLGVRLGSLCSVLIFLLPPIVCMGTVSPIIIQLINDNKESAGSSAGKVYAISTVGGILATFLAGFYMIPELGIHLTAYITSFFLFATTFSYFARLKSLKWLALQIVVMMSVLIIQPSYNLVSGNTEIVYSKVGVLGEWQVVDYTLQEQTGDIKKVRRLLLNGIDQTYTQVGYEPLSLWSYPHKLGAYASIKPEGSNALLLGMGGGSIAHELVSLGLHLDIVELDKNVDHISKTYFNYDESKSNLYIDDARHFIRITEQKYDIVIMDLVQGEVQPAHVFSMEGFQELKEILRSDALVILNFQGNLESEKNSSGPKSIYKTLQAAGYFVNHYSEHLDDGAAGDIFFLASTSEMDYKNLLKDVRYNQWFSYDNFSYDDLINETSLDVSEAEILTDDKPVLEKLNATAILEWRKNKIEQNIKRLLSENLNIY